MAPTGQRPIRTCTVEGCQDERYTRADGSYVNGFCLDHGREYVRRLDPFINAVSRLVDKWTGGKVATYKLHRVRRLALREEAKIIVSRRRSLLAPKKKPLDRRLAKIRRLHRALYQEADNKQCGIKQGWVYFITNPVFPGWVSVGKCSDYPSRKSTYNRADPYRRFEIVHMLWSEDRRAAELEVFALLEPMSSKRQGDWFKVSVTVAKHVAHKVRK